MLKMTLNRLQCYALVTVVVWTVIVTTSLVWNVVQIKKSTLEAIRIQARTAYEKDVIYRRWNANHGGIYVQVTDKMQPNPYLSNIFERDITTPSGKILTLVNPAYMTREVHELAEKEHNILGHITSLNPIRPENVPDPWEIEALRAFEIGETEISSIEEIKGRNYMRLMRPLITEKGCLKCHAVNGYKEGDIRGGISVSIPMEPHTSILYNNMLTLALGHILLWLMGIGGVVFGTQRLSRSERELNKAYEEIQKYTSELEKANILLKQADQYKSIFLASMSHELRTPLNSIIGFTGIILQGMSGEINEEQKKQLTMVKNSSNHLLSLINDLLDISKIEAGKVELSLEEFRLNDVVGEVIETFSTKVKEKGLGLLWEKTEVITLFSDRRRMRQILMNLLSNAIKFTDRGSVKIATGILEDRILEMRITDTGIGIKKEDMNKLFQPFQQIDMDLTKKHKGTGLGLHLTKKLVALLGGDISAESEYGRGSEFIFTLPLKYKKEQRNEENTGG